MIRSLAPAALVLAQASTVLAVPVPAWPVTAADVLLYGVWMGFGLSFAGTVLGSVAAFLLGRRYGWSLVRRLRGADRYASGLHGSDGRWLVPLLALPVPVGGDVGCFMAGLTGMRLRRFVLLACVGRVPGTTLGVLTAAGIATGSATVSVAAVAGLLLLVVLARRSGVRRVQPAPPAAARNPVVTVRATRPPVGLPAAGGSLPRPLAFVLGAGGSHGAVQVGQLRALHEHGVRPDFVVGSSVGALNAAVVAADVEGAAERLDRLWRQVCARDLRCRPTEPITRRRSVLGNDGLRRLLEAYFPPDSTFDDLPVPLYVLAADATTRRQHVLADGPLLPALLASCAIPLLLPAVTIGSTRLVDGGIRHDLPVAEAFELGARSVLALPTTRWPRPVGYRSSAPVSDDRLVVLGGAVRPGTGWTFSRTDRLIEHGYQAVSRQLREEMPRPGSAVPA